MSAYIHHVTLTTGHVRRSPRSEVADAALASLQDALGAALAGGRPAVPAMPGYVMTAAGEGRCLVATIWLEGGPVITVGVATHSRCGTALWRMLHDHATTPVVTRRDRVPPEPWCAARLDPGVVLAEPAEIVALGDLGRVIAWAWLSRLQAARETSQ